MQCQHSQSRAKFAKPAPSADAGEGAGKGFVLPADDGRGSTFYEAVKKLLQQTIETGREEGRLANVQLFGEKFFSLLTRRSKAELKSRGGAEIGSCHP